MPALSRPRNAATASIILTSVKHQHPRQIEFIILSTFASSGSIGGSASTMGWPTPSDESAVPDELVPGAAAVVPNAPPIMDIPVIPIWEDPMPCAPPVPPRANAAVVERPTQRTIQRTESLLMPRLLVGAGRRAAPKGFRLRRPSTPPRT